MCYDLIEVEVMKKFKNFIENRSRILFISSLISVLLFILILPEFLHYSDYIKNIIEPANIDASIAESTIGEVIWSTHAVEAFEEFSLISSCILVFILLFNLAGYMFKKNEFIFISIGLSIIMTCMSIYLSNIIFIISISLATILNVLGYIEQQQLAKKDE